MQVKKPRKNPQNGDSCAKKCFDGTFKEAQSDNLEHADFAASPEAFLPSVLSGTRTFPQTLKMDFLFDPAIWAGLVTLIVLEIVLGIDNLVFVAILAKKLPREQQNRAVYTGLSMALVMRIGLLSIMSWLVTLTAPLFSIFEHPFSARDLILIAGGVFLLFKATLELHERLEARPHSEDAGASKSTFWLVIAQILLLDAVFSLDSIITAVGMVDQLGVMVAAVIVAMIVMILASRPLTNFVNRHPTVVVLCLSFLLMIGFSLVAEGLGFHIPKGYLYAAIGFSIMIEAFNQLANHNSEKHLARLPFRERTTRAIVRLMSSSKDNDEATMAEQMAPTSRPFNEDERHMVEGVLTLAERSIKSIMTPRSDIVWLNLHHSMPELMQHVRSMPHGAFPVCDGTLDQVVGCIKAKHMMKEELTIEKLRAMAQTRPILTVPETITVIRLMQEIKRTRATLVLVADEFGVIQGLATAHDILEAIAGDFPDEGDRDALKSVGEGVWISDGTTDLMTLEQLLEVDGLADAQANYLTIAGFLLYRFGRLPKKGDRHEEFGLTFEVLGLSRTRITEVRITRLGKAERPAT